MVIVAHRGESYTAPENTLAAINLAWQTGDEVVETDVHLSKDGRLMVMHDGSTGRVAGVDVAISETDSTELRKLDIGSWKDTRFAGEKMPFLEEVLDTIPPGKHMLVEVKCGEEILPLLKEIIEESGKSSRITIIGFGLETVSRFKKMMPQIPVLWLRGSKRDETGATWLPHDHGLLDEARRNGLDGLGVNFASLDRGFVDAARSKGLSVNVWTVDDVDEARRMIDMDVDSITTNRAGWMRQQLGL